MGNSARRLPVHTSSNAEPDWVISEEQVQSLEREYYRQQVLPEAREEMLQICRTYLHFRTVERHVGKYAEAEAAWAEAKQAMVDTVRLGEGSLFPFTDAGRLVEEAIFDGFGSVTIRLTARDIQPLTLDTSQTLEDAQPERLELNVSRDFLLRLAGAFRVAINWAEEEITGNDAGFELGSAFTDWLSGMAAWAERHGLPHGSGNESSPSGYSVFLYELKQTFPDNLRPTVVSAAAMVKHLMRQQPHSADK